jgi:tetratricopeptide (TPR) repeat protein
MVSSLIAVVLAASAPVATEGSGIHFVEDDYPAALTQARREHKPIFVDSWATWCHSCLSMRNYVFGDPGLRPVRDAVVWAAIDTEKPVNREFVGTQRVDALPTFLILDPEHGQVLGEWVGTGTVAEMRRFVEDAAGAFSRRTAPDAASAALEQAWAAAGRGDRLAAAAAWERVLAATPPHHPSRPQRLGGLAMALAGVATPEAAKRCVSLGLRELENTGRSATASDFTVSVTTCANKLPKGDPAAAELLTRAEAFLSALVKDAGAPLSVDDRSDAYANLVELLDDAGRHPEALEQARARLALLEGAAASAGELERAATFDAHRVECYLYLGAPEKAKQLLIAREKELPEDYNPPARLARVLFKQRDLAGAAAAMERALAKAPRGKRRVGLLDLKADILAAQGQPVTSVRQEQLELYRELPSTQRSAKGEQELVKALDEAKGLTSTKR